MKCPDEQERGSGRLEMMIILKASDRLVSYGPNLFCGVGVMVYYRQVFLPIGLAWLCEM